MFRRKSHDRLPTAAAAGAVAVCLMASLARCAAQKPVVQVANVPDSTRSPYFVANGTTLNLTCNASNISVSGGTYGWQYSIGTEFCNISSISTSSNVNHIIDKVAVICFLCSYTPPPSGSPSVFSAPVVFYPYTQPSQVAPGESDFSAVTEANITCNYQGPVAAPNVTFLFTRASTGTVALSTATTATLTSSSTYSYRVVNTTTAGDTYYCHLIAAGTSFMGSTTNGIAGVLLTNYTVFTPPYAEMYSFDKKQYTEGDTVKVSCKVIGYPLNNFAWMRESANYSTNATNTVPILGGFNISFTLTSLNHVSERGDYQCTATGKKNGSIATFTSAVKTLHARSKLAPLWPAIGIIAEFALVAIIIGVSESVRSKQALAADGKAGGVHYDGSKKG